MWYPQSIEEQSWLADDDGLIGEGGEGVVEGSKGMDGAIDRYLEEEEEEGGRERRR